jgi:hypothetical protein
VNDPGADGARETERIADGKHQLTGPNLKRIGHGRRMKIARLDPQGSKITLRVSRHNRCLELAVIPNLNADARTANHMRVGYDRTVAGPDNAGTAAAILGVDEHRCSSQLLCNFA